MYRTIIALILISWCWIIGTPVLAVANDLSTDADPPQIISTIRLSGQTSFETAKVIAEHYRSEEVKNVILSTGNGFSDALSASVLAHEKEAPILLVDSTVESSKDAFDYLVQYLDPTGTVYIVGGVGTIGKEFEIRLAELRFKKVVRIAGLDRYDTSYQIASSLKALPVSTVVISSGEQYPDALSISSFAANNGWPILLSPQNALPQEVKDYLLEKKPSKVYITGGVGAISEDVSSEISRLVPQASVERLTGQSRFDTNVRVSEIFAPNPSTVYLATGYGFADALAGSVVAAQNGDPIILIDPNSPTLPKPVASYFAKFYANNLSPNLVSLGGSGVVTDEIIKSLRDLISGTVQETSIYSIADIMTTVTQNDDYSLPKTVPAKLYNSDTMDVSVQWNSTFVGTGSVGTSVYEGVVDGYSKAVTLNLIVKEPGPIAQYTTYFDASLVNRTENIRLAAKALDGKLLAPGEKFSFNENVGRRTVEAGYKEAMIIEGDGFVLGLGGGVCQVSSNLYNVVILADLEILERHRHSLPVDYVPPGKDATVSFHTLDFRFRNSSKVHLLIRSFVEGNALTFQLFGKTDWQ